MSLFDQVQSLLRNGQAPAAVALVQTHAEAGDAEALYALGSWKLYALHVPRDPEGARRCFAAAADQGQGEAARAHAYLTAAGIGCTADPSLARRLLERVRDEEAEQLSLLDRMATPEARRETLSEDPQIELVRGLVSKAECAWLMKRAEPLLRPSAIVDPATRRPAPHPFRTSWGMNFGPAQEDLVVNALNRRLAEASGTEPGWGEPLHILRYAPGQEYRPHLDALPGVANQRIVTALMWLNEDYEGGETHFPELDVTARGDAGDVLIFSNALPDGRADSRTRHAGLPVTRGAKWLATRWIRQSRHHPWDL